MTVQPLDMPFDLATPICGFPPPKTKQEMEPPDYLSTFKAWESFLGTENVWYDNSTCEDYARTTLPQGTLPSGIVRPSTVEEVCEVVKVAHRFGVPLHAISRGKNWGYGDACAPTNGQVIVDLRRMNRIREINVELGYAIIEPGVSQGQLYEHLRDNEIPLMLDVTGAGPEASIVGNILQRGFGHTPYGDRFKHTSGFEIVLPDGRLINTGFGQFENAKASCVFPWGQGPWIDGLFTQSNFGIVTKACIWLMPRPEVVEGFALKIDDEAHLGGLLTALRKLRMNGTLRSTVHVANDLRVLSSRMRYPWERTGGRTPLPDELRRKLRVEHGLGRWNVLGATYGTRAETAAARQVIRNAFRGISRVHFFQRNTLRRAERLLNWLRWTGLSQQIESALASATSAFDLLEGIPSSEHLEGAFWRCKRHDEHDLRNSGLIWVSPVMPMTTEAAAEVLGIITPIFAAHQFEPLITMTAINERALCCVTSINYDKENYRETELATNCAEELHRQLSAKGYYPYRQSSC